MWRQFRKKRHLNSDTSIPKPHKYLRNYVVTDWFQVRGKFFLCIEVVNFIINWMTQLFYVCGKFPTFTAEQNLSVCGGIIPQFLGAMILWWETLREPGSNFLHSQINYNFFAKKKRNIHLFIAWINFWDLTVKSASLQHSQVNISPGESFLQVKQRVFSPGCLQGVLCE